MRRWADEAAGSISRCADDIGVAGIPVCAGVWRWQGEIDIVVKGGNYGWRCREGLHAFGSQTGCPTSGFIDPVAEYDHGLGVSITGGHVYRTKATAIQGLVGGGDWADYLRPCSVGVAGRAFMTPIASFEVVAAGFGLLLPVASSATGAGD